MSENSDQNPLFPEKEVSSDLSYSLSGTKNSSQPFSNSDKKLDTPLNNSNSEKEKINSDKSNTSNHEDSSEYQTSDPPKEDNNQTNTHADSSTEKIEHSREDNLQENSDNEQGSMGLLDHLNELRGRLTKIAICACIGFAICWIFVDPLFNILLEPLLKVLPAGAHAQYTTLPEGFFTRMRVAFVAGLFLVSPLIFYQIWAFVAPGLYDEEKRYILPIAFLSALFFIGGGLFCYYIVFPFAFNFFISYSTPEIVITPKVSDYLSFCLKLIFAFGLIFEMPIFTFFLSRLGILTAAMMRKGRKYAIVGIFILAAILTPPDVVSQLLMACPMLILYEISIWIAVTFGKKKPQNPKTEEPEAN